MKIHCKQSFHLYHCPPFFCLLLSSDEIDRNVKVKGNIYRGVFFTDSRYFLSIILVQNITMQLVSVNTYMQIPLYSLHVAHQSVK